MSRAKLKSEAKRLVVPAGGYEPHAGQRMFHNCEKLVRLLFCHIRWGKTLASCADEVMRGTWLYGLRISQMVEGKLGYHLEPLVNTWHVAPTYKLLDQSVAEIKSLLPIEFGWKYDPIKAKFFIFPYVTPDHRTEYYWHISMRPGDNPEKLVAEGLDMATIEEARGVRREVYDLIMGRCTDPGRLHMVSIVGTPGSMFDPQEPRIERGGQMIDNPHWQYRLYQQALSGENPHVQAWKFGCYSRYRNPYMTDKIIENAKMNMSEEVFKRDMLAEFVKFEQESAVIPEYQEVLHYRECADKYKSDKEVFLCYDPGWNAAMTAHQIDENNVWNIIFEHNSEDTAFGLFVEEAIVRFFNKFGHPKALVIIIPGSAEARKTTDGKTEADILKEVFAKHNIFARPIVIRETEERIERAIDIMRTRCKILSESGEPMFRVDTSCALTNDALGGGWRRDKQRFFKSGMPKPKKDGFFDNVADSVRLLAMSPALDVLGRESRRYVDIEPDDIVETGQDRDTYYGKDI